jgi:predicted amidophosphoribosyltransferase
LEKTGIRLNAKLPKDSDVILIDDKYQSGTTMQFVAMKLQEAGARYIFGISLVKTLRDTDNAS